MSGDIGRTNEQLVEMEFLKWRLKQEEGRTETKPIDVSPESVSSEAGERKIIVHTRKEARG